MSLLSRGHGCYILKIVHRMNAKLGSLNCHPRSAMILRFPTDTRRALSAALALTSLRQYAAHTYIAPAIAWCVCRRRYSRCCHISVPPQTHCIYTPRNSLFGEQPSLIVCTCCETRCSSNRPSVRRTAACNEAHDVGPVVWLYRPAVDMVSVDAYDSGTSYVQP